MNRIFVYGTLKRNHRRNFYLTRDGAKFLHEAATLPAYKLYRPFFADYPCLVEGSVSVQGEVWEVSDKTLQSLDAVEGPGFERKLIVLANGEEAFVYIAHKKPFLACNLGDRFEDLLHPE